jgi:hypothetical protein
MTAFVTVAVGAIAVLTAALVTAFVGPAWKLRHDRRRDAAEVVARYSRPLMQAAYELQSRIYNIDRLRFFTPNSLSDAYRRSYAETSTLWLISQYLGWVEILRREVQFLDLGDIRKTGCSATDCWRSPTLSRPTAGGRRLSRDRPIQRSALSNFPF